MNEDKLQGKDMEIEMKLHERIEKINDSPWICNKEPTLITLHDQYIIFEEYHSETIIFYKDIITMKRDIQVVDVRAIPYDYFYVYYDIIVKTAIENFIIEPNQETTPSLESSFKLYKLTDDLHSQIIDKMVENK